MKHFINKVFLPTIILQVLCLNLNAQPGKTYGMKYWNWMEKYHSIGEYYTLHKSFGALNLSKVGYGNGL